MPLWALLHTIIWGSQSFYLWLWSLVDPLDFSLNQQVNGEGGGSKPGQKLTSLSLTFRKPESNPSNTDHAREAEKSFQLCIQEEKESMGFIEE